ncbi:MAG TPA: PHP domain-containing protein [Pyrinomonadaceae bacterium]|nr:PHP domain-containing protein [Pyrinomonadaceae bacterium]
MKRWKKFALALLVVVALTQVPFACRRHKLGRLAERVRQLDSERAPADPSDPYADHAGVLHVHSALSHDSEGTPEDIVRAAKASGLAFVVMTEHPAAHADTAAATLRGTREGVVFVGGGETVAAGGERLLVFPGASPSETPLPAQEVVNRAKAEGRLVFVAYPEQLSDWNLSGFDGIEVYNLYTNTKRINYARLLFDALWSYASYPDLLFATFYERPDDNLRRWDELTRGPAARPLVAVAGNDAHQNVRLRLRLPTGHTLLHVQFDPYERSFRVVRTHALVERARPLDEDALLSALARGHCFISFDLFGDATGFRFTAHTAAESRIMGDEIRGDGPVLLRVRVPVPARLVFFRDGQVIHEEKEASAKELSVSGSGAYRVEVYPDRLGEPVAARPWIISNPIYVR